MNRQPPPFLTRPYLFAAIFFLAFIFLLYQTARLLAPFFSSLLWAAVIAISLTPLYRSMVLPLKGHTGLTAT